ncbi:MAG: penicillin-binding protein 2 [Thermoleophilia bacterium]|nr:penicillin-binding protein 2 [Thermoleophilia bacterium]
MSGSSLRSRRRRTPIQRAARGISGLSSVARSPREGVGPIAPRIAIAGVLGACVIGILLLRLWALTVIGGAEYVERADSNVIRKLPVVAPRGSILDRNGRPIVLNREMRQVTIDLQDVDSDRLDQVVSDLGRVLAPNRFEVSKVTADIRQKIKNAPPGGVEPVIVARDVPDDVIVHYLAEHQTDFPGVDVGPAYTRSYVRHETAAHILGQVGSVTEEDLAAHPSLDLIDKVGRSGLERRYDEYLRGSNGYEAVEVDAAGVRSDAGIRGLPPTPGRNLVTTVDLPLQRTAEKALARAISTAAATADGRDANAGAVVAIDPRNGEVLTLASYPTYDPNVFVQPGLKNERTASWLNNPNNKRMPMLNRAIMGEYPAGSTFKPITAIAAMGEKFMTPDEPIGCPPNLEIMGTDFPNNQDRNLGGIDLGTALEVSCNTYFYKLSIFFDNAAGPVLQKWASKFGLGQRTGIDLPGETGGLMPTPAWRKETYDGFDEVWKPGDSANLSIGQGDLKITVLQMANAYAAIGNGGTLHTPHVAKSIQDIGGRDEVVLPPGETKELNLDPGDLAAVHEGLKRVNTGGNGTATAVFGSFPIPTAGKTGTAEKFPRTDLAWYCGYAPADNPTIAVCSVIDGGGHGGSAAAPVVLAMYQQWFGEDGGNIAGGSAAD